MNEPHTRNLYERDLGLPPGGIVHKWIAEMAAFVKVGGSLGTAWATGQAVWEPRDSVGHGASGVASRDAKQERC